MSLQDDALKNLWQQAKKSTQSAPIKPATIVTLAKKRKSGAIRIQILNIVILVGVLVVLIAFFTYVAPLRQTLSHAGIALMLGSLALRIVIELYSIYLSGKIDLSEAALKSNSQALRYYRFRKRIHSPVTITIVSLYTIGFYALTPEFSEYFSLPMMILIDASYIVMGVFLIVQIRKGIRKEMRYLGEITEVEERLVNEE